MNVLQENYLKAKCYFDFLREEAKEIEKKIEAEMGKDIIGIDWKEEGNKEVKQYLELSWKYNKEIIPNIQYNKCLEADARELLHEAEKQLINFVKKNLPENFVVKAEDINTMMQHWKYREKLLKLILKTDFKTMEV